ncbi:hypothetical protein [Natrinema salaciae]|uniref:Uncharacterized protein n=1 Tax=Natrinema salaciae TaxID=1186196 RepID=A0A1H9JGI3_9EURY|nr:hypothetical protein [Natrinema salaciae]SEQ85903.1 hypothetical protein SAMN04489841_2546 [Natrinema salaciae]
MVSAPTAGPPPGDDSPETGDGSNPFTRHVSRVIDRFGDLGGFAVVPLLLTMLEFEKVRRASDPAGRGFSITLELLFPSPLVTLWRFANPPDPPAATTHPPRDESYGSPSFGGAPGEPGPSGGPTTPAGPTGSGGTDVTIETPVETVAVPLEALGTEAMVWIGLALVAYGVISAILMAAYVGGIDRRLRHEPIAIGSCVVTYAPRFVLYNLVVFGAFLLVVPVFVLAPPLVLLAIPAIVVVGYVFYPVPFLFVVDDTPFREAFRRSVRLTTAGGPVLGFAFWHLVAGAVSSLVLSLLVSAGGAGFLLALLGSAPLALVLTAATVSFFQEFLESDDLETTNRSRNDGHGTDGTDEYGFGTD